LRVVELLETGVLHWEVAKTRAEGVEVLAVDELDRAGQDGRAVGELHGDPADEGGGGVRVPERCGVGEVGVAHRETETEVR
jgi:hypothetical protein